MAFSRGPKEPIPEVDTNVWACKSEECPGWMREAFSFQVEPHCPLCNADMELEVRVLPEIK